MADGFLHWPKIMPAWAYRDPATIGESQPISGHVSHETVQPSAPTRDRHYTQARRLHIQKLMRSR